MRTVSFSSLLALGLAIQQVAATGWTDADTYNNPYNTNNQCTEKQQKGLGFDDQPNGDLGNYGNLNWKNVQCTNGLFKRTFGKHAGSGSKSFAGGKCASGKASKDLNSSPQISCGLEQKGMSIDTLHVSSSEDTDLELHYGYENGQVCKQTASCSKGGSVIKNSQCGGAQSVIVKLPDTDTKSDCEVGIHSVNFNCGPASSKPPVPSSTPVYSPPILSTPQETKPYPIPTVNSTTSVGPTGPTVPVTTPETVPISTYTPTVIVPTPSTTSPESLSPSVYSTPVVSTPESTVPVETIPTTSTTGYSPVSPTITPGTTVPVLTTEVIVTTLTTCPVTNTVTSGTATSLETTSTISTIFITSTSTVCTECVAPPASTPSTSTIPASPVITGPIPVSSSSNNSPESPTPSVPAPIPVPSSSTPAPVPTTTQAVVTTDIIYTTFTTCPVTSTIVSGTSTSVQIVTTISTITSTSTSTVCTQCVPPPPPETSTPAPPPPVSGTSIPSSPAPTPISSTGNSPVGQTSVAAPPAPSPSAPCPTVLPNCMKTWITLTTCKDNSDSNCYCQDADFTQTVQECVSAWAASDNDVQGALSYLAGICAPHVAQNPGIITNVPKTITLVPTPPAPAPTTSAPALPPASPAPSGNAPIGSSPPPIVAGAPGNSPVGATSPPAGGAAAPVTVLSLSQTVTYACPVSQLADGQPQAPASSSCTSLLNTQVTVPQVGFTTGPPAPGASSSNVGLAAGSPAPVPASPTPGPGGNSPVGATTFGTVVGSASAIGSTKPPGSTGAIPFTGAASSTKVTGFGIFALTVGMLLLA